VQLIESHLKSGDSFLDIGTGSGILMLTAARLGAGRLCGGDRDGTAVRVATENLRRNGIDPRSVCLVEGSLAEPFKGQFDVVAANILTNVIIELLGDLARLLKPGGVFICSGIIDPNRDLVAGKMRGMGFELVEIREKEGWVAMAGRYKLQVHGSTVHSSRLGKNENQSI
jgi:ribosomal protein L11 methyltransferase